MGIAELVQYRTARYTSRTGHINNEAKDVPRRLALLSFAKSLGGVYRFGFQAVGKSPARVA